MDSVLNLKEVVAAGLPTRIQVSQSYYDNTIVNICRELEQLLRGRDRIVVGICGPPGAGKSVFSEILAEALRGQYGHDCCEILGMDGYHFPNSYLDSHYVDSGATLKVPLRTMKGLPATFDVVSFLSDLGRLHDGPDEFSVPVYSRVIHDPVLGQSTVRKNHKFVIVEGMFLLYDGDGFDKVRQRLDYSIYVDSSLDVCRRHLIDRKEMSGKSRAEAEEYFDRIDLPNLRRVASGKDLATRIVPSMVK